MRSASKNLSNKQSDIDTIDLSITTTLAPIGFPPTHEIFLGREHVVIVIGRIVARVRPRFR